MFGIGRKLKKVGRKVESQVRHEVGRVESSVRGEVKRQARAARHDPLGTIATYGSLGGYQGLQAAFAVGGPEAVGSGAAQQVADFFIPDIDFPDEMSQFLAEAYEEEEEEQTIEYGGGPRSAGAPGSRQSVVRREAPRAQSSGLRIGGSGGGLRV